MSCITTDPYISIRDDAGGKSLSTVERDFVRSSALQRPRSLRIDGRRWDQIRRQQLSLVRGENTAHATVQWGGSRVTCSCTAQLLPPYPDRPNEGIVSISVDLSPGASTSYRHTNPVATAGGGSGQFLRGAPPDEAQKATTNRILRCLERMILTGGALDSEALCVTPEQWVWKLELSLTVLDAAGGNVLDASVLAGMAALRHYRKPAIDLSKSDLGAPWLIPADTKEPTPLPLHHTPLALSFALITAEDSIRGSNTSTHHNESSMQTVAIADPNHREELVATGSLVTIAMNIHGEICLVDYAGGCELSPDILKELCRVATTILQKEMCPNLEEWLVQADEQALKERLARLQAQHYPSIVEYRPSGPDLSLPDEVDMEDSNNNVKEAVEQAQTEADEAYRRQALDYNVGHTATAVREDDSKRAADARKEANSLLQALLRSVDDDTQHESTDHTKQVEEDVNMSNVDSSSAVPPEEGSREADAPIPSAPSVTKTDEQKTEVMELGKAKKAAVESDEEEETTLLKSEFETSPLPVVQNDEDIDDLAGAIKKKKPKKRKK